MRSWLAPVNAPRTAPNNSLSSRVSVIAAQLQTTKGPAGNWTQAVQRARHQLLARSGRTANQHRSKMRRDAAYGHEDFLHDGALSYHALKLERVVDVLLQPRAVLASPRFLE